MTIKNIDIYLSRLLSALCLFWILSEANVYLDGWNNTVLVLGYRFFIISTPLLYYFFRDKITYYAFIFAEIGLVAWYFNYFFAGTVFFGLGIAVSGYMLKYHASHTAKGSAGNKIALNLGSIGSGLLVSFGLAAANCYLISMIVIAVSALTYYRYAARSDVSLATVTKQDFSFSALLTPKGLAWCFVGIVTGVKLISFVTILPQFILQANHGNLPFWFGYLIIANSVFVVLFQSVIMNWIIAYEYAGAVIALFAGMVIIAGSGFMRIDSIAGAIVWTLALSFVECCISYLDTLAKKDNFLLIKEAAVGIGSAATVFLVRFYHPEQASLCIGAASIALLLFAVYLQNVPGLFARIKPHVVVR